MGTGRLFNPSDFIEFSDVGPTMRCHAGGTINAYDIVYVNSNDMNLPTVVQADASLAATTYGRLGIALGAATSGQEVNVAEWYIYRNIDTSGYSADGVPAFLSDTAGEISATVGTIPRVVGVVLDVSATAGVVLLHPSGLEAYSTAYGVGTNNVSWTVNLDAAAATNEDPQLILLGGDATAAPNDDIVRSRVLQDSSAELVQFSTERSRNGGAYAYITPAFHIGRNGETTADLDAQLVFNAATTGSAARQAIMIFRGQENRHEIYGGTAGYVTRWMDDMEVEWGTDGDFSAVFVSASNRMDMIGLDTTNAASAALRVLTGNASSTTAPSASGAITISTGTATASGANGGASGASTLSSGSTSVGSAHVGGASGAVNVASGNTTAGFAGSTCGASGAVTVRSGTTDISVAGVATAANSGAVTVQSGGTNHSGVFAGTAGNSGAVIVQSGDCTSTGAGATSGSSGAVTVESGTSDDANTGAVTVQSGVPAAAGTSGNITIQTGACTGAGTSGNIALTAGTTVGGTRGNVIATANQLQFRPVDQANFNDNIPLRFGTNANAQGSIDYNSAGTTFRIDGLEPAADNSSINVLMESGAVTSQGGARTSGNITLRSGTSDTDGNNGGVSGAWVGGTGTTDAASAHTGGNSGPVTLTSGDTDASDGGGTGGASGTVTVASGDCNATAGTSGSSGAATIESGDSASANTGAVNVRSGTPAAAGTSGDVAISTGSTAGDGTSGSITFTPGTTVAGTRGTVQSVGRLTTTDGVAAGTARVVGGRAYSNTADSSAVSNTTAATAFDVTYNIPANTLNAGSVVSVKAVVRVTADNVADTLTLVGRIGGTAVVTSNAVDVAAGDTIVMDYFVITRAAAGAAVDSVGGGTIIYSTGAAGTISTASTMADGVTLATNGALAIDVTAQWSAASAGDSCFLESLYVRVE